MARKSQVTFLELFRKFINYHRDTKNHFNKRDPGTIKYYYIKYRTISEFLESKGLLSIAAQSFNLKLANELIDYLSEKYSHNYTVRTVEACRMVTGYGMRNGIIGVDLLASLKLKKLPAGEIVCLTRIELDKLITLNELSKDLQKAKDMFVFQCLTGLDYSDMTTVRLDHIKEYRGYLFIVKKRNKTVNEANIPYNKEAAEIFEKYGHNLKLMPNANYNLCLKEIAQLAGITKRITSHTGRKTFGMLKLNDEGFNIASVSKMLGHRSIRTTEEYYARPDINLVADELEKYNKRE
jgi:integrase/recombinase XerD